jgi:transcriptional regulator with GAF, ATPase, and Fis domain
MTYIPERKIKLNQFRAISHAISTYEDVILLSKHIVESICRTFEIKASCVLLFDDRDKQFFCVSRYGLSDDYLCIKPECKGDQIEEFISGKPVFFTDFVNDPRVEYKEAAIKEGIAAMLSIPIKSRENVVGLLKLYNSEKWIIHDEDTQSIAVLAEQFGLVIENNGLKNFLEEVKAGISNLPLRMLRGL